LKHTPPTGRMCDCENLYKKEIDAGFREGRGSEKQLQEGGCLQSTGAKQKYWGEQRSSGENKCFISFKVDRKGQQMVDRPRNPGGVAILEK